MTDHTHSLFSDSSKFKTSGISRIFATALSAAFCVSGLAAQDQYVSIPQLFESLRAPAVRQLKTMMPLSASADFEVNRTTPCYGVPEQPCGHIQGMGRLPDGRYMFSHDMGTNFDYGLLLVECDRTSEIEVYEIYKGKGPHPGPLSTAGGYVANANGHNDYVTIFDEFGKAITSVDAGDDPEVGPGFVYHPGEERYYLLIQTKGASWKSKLYKSNDHDLRNGFSKLGELDIEPPHNGDGGTMLVYDATDPGVLYHVSLERRDKGLCEVTVLGVKLYFPWFHEFVDLSKIELAGLKVSRVISGGLPYELPLEGASYCSVTASNECGSTSLNGCQRFSSGFRWAGSLHADQYTGRLEVAASPRNFDSSPLLWPISVNCEEFHNWVGYASPSPLYAGADDLIYVYQNNKLYETKSESGWNTPVGNPQTAPIAAAAVMDDVIYTVQNGEMKRHELHPDPSLPVFQNATNWAGTVAMAAPRAPLPQFLYVVKNGDLYRVEHNGTARQLSIGWNKTTAMEFVGKDLYILGEPVHRPHGLYRVDWNNPNSPTSEPIRSYDGFWTDVDHMAEASGKLYVTTTRGQLFEVWTDGTYRMLNGNWKGTEAIGRTSGGMLAIVQNGTMYRADPDVGGWRPLSGSWSGTEAIVCPSYPVRVTPTSRQLSPGVQSDPVIFDTTVSPKLGTLSYQWYKDDILLPSQVLTQLVAPSLACEDSGVYHCVVSGFPHEIISNKVQLIVGPTGYERFRCFGTTQANGDTFGRVIAGVGDVDGDGYDDYAFGHPEANGDMGYVQVVSGATQQTIMEHVSCCLLNFGASLAGGDFDGDGKSDVFIGCPATYWAHDSGVYILTTGSGATPSPWLMRSAKARGLAGKLVATGHFNEDTKIDGLITLDPDGGSVAADTVIAWTFKNGVYEELWTIQPIPGEDITSMVVVGDFSNDGYDDFALGFSGFAGGNGIVVVYSGRDGGGFNQTVGDPGERLGHALAAIGDVNGDNEPDLAMAGPGWNGDYGRVRIRNNVIGQILSEKQGGSGIYGVSKLGLGLASAGDFDGNRVGDVMIAERSVAFGGGALVQIFDGFTLSGVSQPFGPFGAFPLMPANAPRLAMAAAHTNGGSTPGYLIEQPMVPAKQANGEVYCYDARPIADPPGVSLFGRSCADSAGRLARIDVNAAPRIGNTVKYLFRAARTNSSTAIVIGMHRRWRDLSVINMPGCLQLVSPLIVFGANVNSAGWHEWPLYCPNDPNLIGLTLMFQHFPFDRGLPAQMSASHGLEVTIGAR